MSSFIASTRIQDKPIHSFLILKTKLMETLLVTKQSFSPVQATVTPWLRPTPSCLAYHP